MDTNVLKRIFAKHRSEGCFIVCWDEWENKVRKAYAELIHIAQKVPYDQITVTYAELGRRIDLFPLSDSFHLKIAWILYACATYAFGHGLPLITALVVNSETRQPGQGFWGLEGIPVQLRKVTKIEDIAPFRISGERDKFWVEELRRIDIWGKTTNQQSKSEGEKEWPQLN
jgi:hypothetical protein